MGLYMDVHTKVQGLTPAGVVRVDRRNVDLQAGCGVTYRGYWYDDATGKVSCLVEAANRAAAAVVHHEVHGLAGEAKVGPRTVGMTGGVLYGSGLFPTSFADDRLWLLYLAYGFGAILGPMLIATIREATGDYTPADYSIAAIMLASALVPFLLRPPTPHPEVSARLHDRRPATTRNGRRPQEWGMHRPAAPIGSPAHPARAALRVGRGPPHRARRPAPRRRRH
jgi:hypothetical protein